MNYMVFPIALLLLAIIVETAILQWQGRHTEFDWKETILNLNSGHVMLWIFRGMEVALFSLVSTHFSIPVLSQLPTTGQWVFAFILWDFCFYLLHYLHHKIGLFRALHEVHHEGRHFNISLGARNSWYSSLSSIPFFIWMAFLGLPADIFLVISTLHYGIQLFNHSALTPRLGWLEHIMVTPSHHRVHHGQDKHYCNSNFGGSLIIWDKLFGTFQQEKPDIPLIIGTRNPPASLNPFHTNHDTLFRWLRKTRPIRPQPISGTPTWLIASGGITLFLIVILHVGGETVWPAWQYYLLSIMLTLATIALGGMSEGRRWGHWAWGGIIITLTLLIRGLFDWHQWYWSMLCSLLLLHATASLLTPTQQQ